MDTPTPASPQEAGGRSEGQWAGVPRKGRLPTTQHSVQSRLAAPQITHISDLSKRRTPGGHPLANSWLTGLAQAPAWSWVHRDQEQSCRL